MQVLDLREDFATAVNLLGNERETFSEILLLDYCFRTIKSMETAVANQKDFAEEVLARLLAKKSADQFYHWVKNRGIRDDVPVGSDHTPPDSTTSSSSSRNNPPHLQETTILPRFC